MSIVQNELNWLTVNYSPSQHVIIVCKNQSEQIPLVSDFNVPQTFKDYCISKGLDVDFESFGLTYHAPVNSFSWNGGANSFTFSDSDYEQVVTPFIELWQAEYDRIEQEQEEAEAEYNKFENRQARALTQLNTDFETVKERSHVKSSLGFEVDANQTANENVNGLLITIGDGTCQFCDYYNQFHELNKAQLETLQSEIIANAQNLYQQKWVYRTQIEGCTDNSELDTVLEGIKFTYMDFTQATE